MNSTKGNAPAGVVSGEGVKVAGLAESDYTTAAEVYTLLSGSLVTVDHPEDLMAVGRFLSLYEAGIDDARLWESLQSVRDLLAFGRIHIQGVSG